jgi:drug/metabolite transporter (DMT)-like permease
MTWFLLMLACLLLWGISGILYKAASPHDDCLSHYKNFIWTGIIMALAGGIMGTWSETLLDSVKMVWKNALFLIPLCVIYATVFFFGLYGKRFLSASIITPLENIGGALAAIIIYYYYLLTGYIDPAYPISILDFIASISIIIAVVMIGKEEQSLFKAEARLKDDKKKHPYGALVLFFPLIYALIDVFSVAEIGGIGGNNDGIVTENAMAAIPAMDFFIFECLGFVIISIFVWIYLFVVKKHTYNPFEPKELLRCGAATGETFGTMTFTLAAAINPVLTAPIASFHCVITILLARIFLKEHLSKKQYLCLGLLLFGIILLGISDIFGI